MSAPQSDRDLLVEAVTLLRPLVKKVDALEQKVDALESIRDRAKGYIAGVAAAAAALSSGVTVSALRLLGH